MSAAIDFAAAMARLESFETRPLLAVAVSGGADSLALALLAADWARERDGEAVALTVDHGLRPESRAEAEQTGRWLAEWGISHFILPWTGDKPASGLMEAARAARYRLLGNWCREKGALHLLLAHHREDQAETVLQRLARGAGESLAAMSPVAETQDVRLLRPLLGFPKEALRGHLRSLGQEWIEDPSNENQRFERPRLRSVARAFARAGLSAVNLSRTAARLASLRSVLEKAAARLASEAVFLHPAGFARLSPDRFRRADPETALKLLNGLTGILGGGAHPPRRERLENLLLRLFDPGFRGATLAGCRFAVSKGEMLICREAAAIDDIKVLSAGRATSWDSRFRVRFGGSLGCKAAIAALGADGWRDIRKEITTSIPAMVIPSLPAFFDRDGVFSVPHLGYKRTPEAKSAVELNGIWLAPTRPLALSSGSLAYGAGMTIS